MYITIKQKFITKKKSENYPRDTTFDLLNQK